MRFIARRYDKVLTQPRCPDNSCVRSSCSIHVLELYNDFPTMVSQQLRMARADGRRSPAKRGTYYLLFAIVRGYLCRLEPLGASLRDEHLSRLCRFDCGGGVGSFTRDTAVMSSTQKGTLRVKQPCESSDSHLRHLAKLFSSVSPMVLIGKRFSLSYLTV
jgi:hypothetical protein